MIFKKKFTVITPVYNGERYIQETIESVLACIRGINYEYLVIDDGSTDSTSEIVQKYKDRLTLISKKNSGQADAINTGLSRASGEYSTIVNCDDPILSPSLFLEALKILDKNPRVVATYPDWRIIDAKGKTLSTVRVKEFSVDEMVGNFNCLIGPGGIFRTEKAQEIGGWKNTYRYVPDYDFWLRLTRFGVFQRVPMVLATWRTHENSISVGSKGSEMARERVMVIDEYIQRTPELTKRLIAKSRSESRYRASILMYFDSKVNGKKLLLDAFRIKPTSLFSRDIRVVFFVMLHPISRVLINKFLPKFLKLRIEESVRSEARN